MNAMRDQWFTCHVAFEVPLLAKLGYYIRGCNATLIQSNDLILARTEHSQMLSTDLWDLLQQQPYDDTVKACGESCNTRQPRTILHVPSLPYRHYFHKGNACGIIIATYLFECFPLNNLKPSSGINTMRTEAIMPSLLINTRPQTILLCWW
jgi:hypothetical protein